MSRASPVQSILRSAGVPAIVLILMGFFGYNAVLGPNGALAWKDTTHQLEQRAAEYAALEQRRKELRNRVELLGGKGGADPDMVEEEVRRQLNLVRPDEIIVPLPPRK